MVGTEWAFEKDEAVMATQLSNCLAQCGVPESLWEGLTWYILYGRPTGSFLEAVICNDLKQACAKADNDNKTMLWTIVNFLYNHAPTPCWGDKMKYDHWRRTLGVLQRRGPLGAGV